MHTNSHAIDFQKAFTLVELMIAISIFAVLALGLTQFSGMWVRGGKESIQQSDSMQKISVTLYKIRQELRRCKQFDSPAVKMLSNRIKFVSNDQIVVYEFSKKPGQKYGSLVREIGLDSEVLIRGLENVSFYRLDQRFLQISFELLDKSLTTRLYLREL